jgi:hypothetical protein
MPIGYISHISNKFSFEWNCCDDKNGHAMRGNDQYGEDGIGFLGFDGMAHMPDRPDDEGIFMKTEGCGP